MNWIIVDSITLQNTTSSCLMHEFDFKISEVHFNGVIIRQIFRRHLDSNPRFYFNPSLLESPWWLLNASKLSMPSFLGWMYDHLGDYTAAFLVAGIPPIVGALLMFIIHWVDGHKVPNAASVERGDATPGNETPSAKSTIAANDDCGVLERESLLKAWSCQLGLKAISIIQHDNTDEGTVGKNAGRGEI